MRNNTLSLARGGIFVALSFILLYLSTIIPINRLFILGLSAAIIPLSIITIGIQKTIIVYVSTSILGILFLGLKINVIGYISLFGIYGFVKLYIEKLSNLPIEIILKLVYFNISIYIIFLIFKFLIIDISITPLPLPIFIAALQIIFLVSDYALSMIIGYSDKHLLKKLSLFNK